MTNEIATKQDQSPLSFADKVALLSFLREEYDKVDDECSHSLSMIAFAGSMVPKWFRTWQQQKVHRWEESAKMYSEEYKQNRDRRDELSQRIANLESEVWEEINNV